MTDLERLKILKDKRLKIVNDALKKECKKLKITLTGDETNAEICTKINAR